MQLLHPCLVCFALVGQHLGFGSISARVCKPTFLKTTPHLVSFVVCTCTQGDVVRIILVDLVRVLLVASSTVIHVVEH